MQEISAIVKSVIQRTPTIKSLQLTLPQKITYKAGQSLVVTLGGNPLLTRTLSFCSSPTDEGTIEISKRISQSDFSKTYDSLKVGEEVKIKFPIGMLSYTGEPEKIALLAGGIGITPFVSICRYVAQAKLGCDVVLLYSNRSKSEIAFEEELNSISSANPSIRIIYTVTDESTDWAGLSERISPALIKSQIPDYRERRFFLCGTPGMVESLATALKEELLLPLSEIKAERFLGYK